MPLNATQLLVSLAEAGRMPPRVHLATALRETIRTGQLTMGTTLPSTRILAQDLGVSRGVVVDAYAQLAAEGYIQSRPGAGTTVVYVPAALPEQWQRHRPVPRTVPGSPAQRLCGVPGRPPRCVDRVVAAGMDRVR